MLGKQHLTKVVPNADKMVYTFEDLKWDKTI
jgi:hypothetical protein